MSSSLRPGFWREALTFRGSVTPKITPHVAVFGAFATLICILSRCIESYYQTKLSLEVWPHEIAGAALGLLLILRTNAGHSRWWEARKLWGGIVNQSRNLIIGALAYGPADPEWRQEFSKWAAAFPHIARLSLRGERTRTDLVRLLGEEDATMVMNAEHMPSLVAMKLAELLRDACERFDMDRFAFLRIDKERAELIDHLGACERILKTPLPMVYAIKVRRFILVFLLTLPLALLHRMSGEWMVPIITMMVAYPLIALDQIGVELQNPFATVNLSHLPLNDISQTIEGNVKGLLKNTACVLN